MEKFLEETSVAQVIRRRRRELGLTLQELAVKVGLRTAQSIANWESGSATPRAQQLQRLAVVLKVDRQSLIHLAARSRIRDELVQDPQSFADLMYLMGHTGGMQVSFYIICQKTLTLENPALATAIAKLAWDGIDVVYVYLQSELSIWAHNMDSAFDGFDLSLAQLSRDRSTAVGDQIARKQLEAAQQKILRFNGCNDAGELGIKHTAMISPFLTAVYCCSHLREKDMMWFAIPKAHETSGAVWHKLPYDRSQLYRSWISHDLGIVEPYTASAKSNDGRLQSLREFITERASRK